MNEELRDTRGVNLYHACDKALCIWCQESSLDIIDIYVIAMLRRWLSN